ncbi:rhodanese-like domain-containing protein [Dietzia aerolata]|uniref:rhodanese-like domain-containing protein n=1 Tax=Dietzia aerolata TaxID=595984 RepID=UPI0036378FD1
MERGGRTRRRRRGPAGHPDPGEVADGAIPGALNIPVDELRDRMDELPDGRVLAYCAVGVRGYLASRILVQAGREAVNLDGGYTTWKAATQG